MNTRVCICLLLLHKCVSRIIVKHLCSTNLSLAFTLTQSDWIESSFIIHSTNEWGLVTFSLEEKPEYERNLVFFFFLSHRYHQVHLNSEMSHLFLHVPRYQISMPPWPATCSSCSSSSLLHLAAPLTTEVEETFLEIFSCICSKSKVNTT